MASKDEEGLTRNDSAGQGGDRDDGENDGKNNKTNVEDMSLLSITSGENGRGIPIVKFIDDVEEFATSFKPMASAELMIGAYSELHQKFKTFETSLNSKSKYGTGSIFECGANAGFFGYWNGLIFCGDSSRRH